MGRGVPAFRLQVLKVLNIDSLCRYSLEYLPCTYLCMYTSLRLPGVIMN